MKKLEDLKLKNKHLLIRATLIKKQSTILLDKAEGMDRMEYHIVRSDSEEYPEGSEIIVFKNTKDFLPVSATLYPDKSQEDIEAEGPLLLTSEANVVLIK